MAAQAIPPSAPNSIIVGSSQTWPPLPKRSASQPEQMAPIVYMPSAPMFQTLARKPTARPSPIRIRGDALSSHSETPFAELKGSMKKIRKVEIGFKPSARKNGALTSTVSTSAMTGAPRLMKRKGSVRGSSWIRIISSRDLEGGTATGHQQPDFFGIGRGARLRIGKPSLKDHRDPVADFEQSIQLFGYHQAGDAPAAQVDQTLPQKCRRRNIDAPRRLRNDQDARRQTHLAPHDEFLQISAGQAARSRRDPHAFDAE